MTRIVAVAASVALLFAVAGPAHADSTTVSGTGDITKMSVNNGDTSVTVKIFAPGGKCDVRYVAAKLKGKDGVTYTAAGGCYPGGVWAYNLNRGSKIVKCADDRLSYNAAKGFWRFFVPRSCLGRLTNTVKASGELTYGPTPGEAGPTSWLRRG